jgi:hypothetical protein
MSQLSATGFGLGTPATYPFAQNPVGIWPQVYPQTLSNPLPGSGFGVSPFGMGAVQSPPIQQIALLLQTVPQQLQQVQQLQQQQLVYLNQLLQWIPAQLQQIQQSIQLLPYQIQQGQPLGAGIAPPVAFGLTPQPFAGQTTLGHVM